MKVCKIDFEVIKQYWIEVDHFREPNKLIKPFVRRLGPHKTIFDNPRRIAYGLFCDGKLIGVTQLVQWSNTQVRYRTLNIRENFRGKNLGWYLLETAYNTDWRGCGNLFGWVRDTHYEWALRHKFFVIDSSWIDNHIAMERIMQ